MSSINTRNQGWRLVADRQRESSKPDTEAGNKRHKAQQEIIRGRQQDSAQRSVECQGKSHKKTVQTISDVGPSTFIELVRCFAFGLVRAVHQLSDTFLGAS